MMNKKYIPILILLLMLMLTGLASTVSADSDVTIYVEDSNGARLAHAKVDVTRIGGEPYSITVYTDSSGMADVTLEEGTYQFVATYMYSSVSFVGEITDPGPHTIQLVIYQSPFDFLGAIGLFGLFIIAIFIIFYLWVLVMVFKDAEARGQSGALWLLIVLFTNLLGLIIWFLVRGRLKKSKKKK